MDDVGTVAFPSGLKPEAPCSQSVGYMALPAHSPDQINYDTRFSRGSVKRPSNRDRDIEAEGD